MLVFVCGRASGEKPDRRRRTVFFGTVCVAPSVWHRLCGTVRSSNTNLQSAWKSGAGRLQQTDCLHWPFVQQRACVATGCGAAANCVFGLLASPMTVAAVTGAPALLTKSTGHSRHSSWLSGRLLVAEPAVDLVLNRGCFVSKSVWGRC